MAPENILDLLHAEWPAAIVKTESRGHHPHAVVKAEHWRELARFLRDDERLRFDWLRCLTGVDQLEDGLLTAIYDLHATFEPERANDLWRIRNEIAIKIQVPRDNPHIPSVADVWPAADWHERETYDLLGIVFDGHPNLTRILCCDDWVGHPLRKDYEFPLEYNGIPGTTEYSQIKVQH